MIFVYEKGFGFEHEMREKGVGLVFIISAPSGTGKTTLVREVIQQLPGLQFSVSYTTRLPRSNEKEGGDYHFVSHSVFQKMVERNEFLEWAEVLGNRYGTPRSDLKKLELEGFDLILDIDTQGAKKVMKEIAQPVLIYLLPPSLKVLRERLRIGVWILSRWSNFVCQMPEEIWKRRMGTIM
jgi:guanylate kinase